MSEFFRPKSSGGFSAHIVYPGTVKAYKWLDPFFSAPITAAVHDKMELYVMSVGLQEVEWATLVPVNGTEPVDTVRPITRSGRESYNRFLEWLAKGEPCPATPESE